MNKERLGCFDLYPDASSVCYLISLIALCARSFYYDVRVGARTFPSYTVALTWSTRSLRARRQKIKTPEFNSTLSGVKATLAVMYTTTTKNLPRSTFYKYTVMRECSRSISVCAGAISQTKTHSGFSHPGHGSMRAPVFEASRPEEIRAVHSQLHTLAWRRRLMKRAWDWGAGIIFYGALVACKCVRSKLQPILRNKQS